MEENPNGNQKLFYKVVKNISKKCQLNNNNAVDESGIQEITQNTCKENENRDEDSIEYKQWKN